MAILPRSRSRLAIPAVVLLIASINCNGGGSPTVPTIPPANLVSQGSLSFPSCNFGSCGYQGEAQNTGTGCAVNVRGVTRLFNSSGVQQAVDDWSLSSGRRIRPQESFLYSDVTGLPQSVVGQSGGYYRTDISWDNVAC